MKIKSFYKNYQNDHRGVAATEFALMAPVLIIILVAMVDYGFYINNALRVENTARAAAEYMLRGGDENALMEDIIMPGNMGLSASDAGNLSVSTSYSCECADAVPFSCENPLTCEQGDYMRRYLQVSLEMTHSTLFPYPGIPSEITLSGQTRLQANE